MLLHVGHNTKVTVVVVVMVMVVMVVHWSTGWDWVSVLRRRRTNGLLLGLLLEWRIFLKCWWGVLSLFWAWHGKVAGAVRAVCGAVRQSNKSHPN